jgi:hypothetical protein
VATSASERDTHEACDWIARMLTMNSVTHR